MPPFDATDEIRIVFDAYPGPYGGRFIEVEDKHGRSISAGTWHKKGTGAELRIQFFKVLNRAYRQWQVGDWVCRAFGEGTMKRPDERGARVLEEAMELFQALGGTPETALKIRDYVFARPVGDPFQELGGVGVTLLAAAEALGMSAEDAEGAELARVLAKPLEHFKQRQAEKRAAGLTPGIRSDDT